MSDNSETKWEYKIFLTSALTLPGVPGEELVKGVEIDWDTRRGDEYLNLAVNGLNKSTRQTSPPTSCQRNRRPCTN